MPSSLGIYVEENLIKYAKVNKEKDAIKVEAFNIEFYDNLNEALRKIINETYSYKIPISINISDELYNYFDVFAMLNKKDVKKSIDIEFETLCNEKEYNMSSLETRYILTKTKKNDDKYKALHVAVNKNDINRKLQALKDAKVQNLSPISTSITNLLEINEKDNIAIINIEDETKITTIVDGQINRIDVLQDGMGKILNEINKKENSMKKAYEVCKNITIYTQETQPLNLEESTEHLEDVMPTLYKIVTESKQIIESTLETIDKVYITGLGTAINNIDLYFQEYMVNAKCEILKPFFVESSSVKIPIKEYIEVNSAIALALDGLGYGKKELNFTKGKANLNPEIDVKSMFKGGQGISFSFSGPLDLWEKLLLRGCAACLIVIVGFLGYSNAITNSIEERQIEVQKVSSETTKQLGLMDADLSKINAKTNAYSSAIDSINSLAESQEDTEVSRIIEKDAIPNMLSKIMFLIPQKVKLTSIKNLNGTRISIEAESDKYEQLGYFTSVLKTQKVLTNIKSTSGSRTDSVVKITIEGDLP